MKPVAFDAALRARLATNLSRHAPAPPAPHALKRAAVCVLVIDDGRGEAAFLLTRRAEHLSAHSGQYALPGGRIDGGESALEAARREAREEIGLELAALFLGERPYWFHFAGVALILAGVTLASARLRPAA